MAVTVNAESGYNTFIINTYRFDQYEPGTAVDQSVQILHATFLLPKKCPTPEAAF